MKYFLTFTILISFSKSENASSSVLFQDRGRESNLNKFLVNLLRKYEGFIIVFHVDLETKDTVDDIVQYLYNNRTPISFVVYNYDKLQHEVEFIRPEVANVLHLLFPENVSYWYRLNSHNKIWFQDVIVFVTVNQNLRLHIIDEKWKIIKMAGKILLLEFGENNTIHLYKICFYCGNKSKTFSLLENINSKDLLNDFHNLNGHLLRLVFFPNFPYLYCKKSKRLLARTEQRNVCLRFGGFEGQMMRVISKKMNFKYTPFLMDSNNTFMGMLKYVNSTRADIAFGAISITLDRRPVIQYTQQIHAEAYTFVYRSSMSFGQIFQKFLNPFRPHLAWLLFLASMALLSTLLYMILKVNKHIKMKQTTLHHTFWILFHMPMEQSVQNINSVYRGLPASGLVLSLWWLCCLVFCTMYKSMVLSAMVQPMISDPEDLKQLLTVGYRIVGHSQARDIIQDLLNVSDPLYSDALEKVVYGANDCDAFSEVINDRAAMLDEQSMIQYGIRRKCPISDAKVNSQLRIARYPVRSSGHAWSIQHGAPYRQAIDHYLGLILSGGLFLKWQKDETSLAANKPIPLSREKRNQRAIAVPLRALQPLFVIYGVGILLSTLCLITEILYFAYDFHQRSRMKIRCRKRNNWELIRS